MSLAESNFICSNLDDSQLNLGYFADNLLDCGDSFREKLKLDDKDANKLKTFIKDGILHIEFNFPFCPNCGKINLKSNGWNDRKLIFPDTGSEVVKIRKYVCLDKCNDGKNKYFTTNINSIVNPNSNYTKIFKQQALDLYEVGTVSLRNSAELMNFTGKTSVSHQSIENWILAINRDELKKPEKLSGYYGYDVQHVRNYSVWQFRHLLVDTYYNTIVADEQLPDETSETIEKFLNNNLFNKPKKAIVSDLKKEYKPIIEKMGMEHQWCMKHARDALKKRIKVYKKENKTTKYESDLMYYYMNKIMLIYECEDYDQAKKHRDAFIRNFKYLPEVIKIMLSNLIIPYFKTFTLFLRDSNVPRTNNLCERVFHKTYPKYIKRQGKIKEGTEARCAIKEHRWDERNANF